MAYYEQSLLSNDSQFRDRIAACAAVEVELGETHPLTWAGENQWMIAASPGFADKYSYALETGVQNPGRDTSVISDNDILAAVQSLSVPASQDTS